MKAVFLDRDGVINVHEGRIDAPDKLDVFEYSGKAIKRLNDCGFKVFVVTNQPEIAKGFFGFDDLKKVHDKLVKVVSEDGGKIDGFYVCPHHPEKGWPGEVVELKIECKCRKPKPGLLLQAAKEHDIDLDKSWMVGDSKGDIVAGERAGARTVFVTAGGGSGAKQEKSLECKPDYTCENLDEASLLIVENCES